VGTTADNPDIARNGHGLILTSDDGGATWTTQTTPARVSAFSDVTCPTADACVVVGSTVLTSRAAGVVVFTGSATDPWGHLSVHAVPQSLSSVVCVTTNACTAAGQSISAHLGTH
jgi:photosystem II stability/assembly factor-like uncharacterized protein